MTYKEIQLAGPLDGFMRIPGSKSITNRALMCAALAGGKCILTGASDSDDTSLMINGLNLMGVLVRRSDDTLKVEGKAGVLYAPRFPIPVGNAGTTLRFLLSAAALARGEVVFEASLRMGERPIEDLLVALRALGVAARYEGETPRYTVGGGPLRGGTVAVRGDKSSQFLSSLLMCAPYATGDVTITVEGPLASASYVEMTCKVMQAFGVAVEQAQNNYLVRSGQRYQPTSYNVEPDASGISYPLGAAAIAGGCVEVHGIARSSMQGDIGFVSVLERMNCEVVESVSGIRLQRRGRLLGIDVDMNTMPDVVPTLAAVALFAEGPTVVRNVGHLRFKESDRLSTLAAELSKLGAKVNVIDDGLKIEPTPLHGGELDPHDDHRMAMTFALIGLRVPGIRVLNPACVGKSFPRFWDELDRLTGRR